MTKVQRYKAGYYTDEWGMSSNTPCLIPDDSGYAVKFEDYCKLETELAEKDAEVEKLKRLNLSYSSLTKAQEGQLTALRNRLYELRGADKMLDSEREANAILTEQLSALKTENESLKRDAERLDFIQSNCRCDPMKTITYNPETHALVPREPTRAMCDAALAFDDNKPLNDWGIIVSNTYEETYSAMISAAPQPEPVDVGSVGWKHDCAALCANDIELWIDRCPHCGKPRHNHPPTDDELLNKAEPVDVEPAMWVMKHIRSGDLAQAKPNQKALHPYMLSDAFPLYTTPQPGRTAELEAALKVARDALEYYVPMIKQGDSPAEEAIAKIEGVWKHA